MPITLKTTAMKARESVNDPWETITVKAEAELEPVLEITGDGDLDPGFTATDLTGAVNELGEASVNYTRKGQGIDSLADLFALCTNAGLQNPVVIHGGGNLFRAITGTQGQGTAVASLLDNVNDVIDIWGSLYAAGFFFNARITNRNNPTITIKKVTIS